MPNAVEQAAHLAGGQAALARAIQVSAPTVNQWVKGLRPVPITRCPQIEAAVQGRVRCEQLRPDIAWEELRGAVAQPAAMADGA